MLTISQPYLAGVLAGSVFLVGVRWFTTILPSESYRKFTVILC